MANPIDPTAKTPVPEPNDLGTNLDQSDEHRGTLGAYLGSMTKGGDGREVLLQTMHDDGGLPIAEHISISRYMGNHIPVTPALDTREGNFIAAGSQISNISGDSTPPLFGDSSSNQRQFIRREGMSDEGMTTVPVDNSIIQASAIRKHFEHISNGIFFEETWSPPSGDVGNPGDPNLDPYFKNNQAFGHGISRNIQVGRLSDSVSQVLLNNRFSPSGLGGVPLEGAQKEGFAWKFINNNVGTQTGSPVDGEHRLLSGFSPNKPNYYAGDSAYFSKMAKFGKELMIRSSGNSSVHFDKYDPFTAVGSAFHSDELKKWTEAVKAVDAPALAEIDTGAIFTGTNRVSMDNLNPQRSWLGDKNTRHESFGDHSLNIHDVELADQTGAPITSFDVFHGQLGGVSNEESTGNKSWGQLTDHIHQFHGRLFGKYYRMALQSLVNLFLSNIVTGLLLDAVLAIGEAAQAKDQKLFTQEQKSSGNLRGRQLSKGRRRGTGYLSAIPVDNSAGDILDLLGVKDFAEMLSGPGLAYLILDILNLPIAVNTQNNFWVGRKHNPPSEPTGGLPAGKVLSFSASFFIGATQTFVHAILDPLSGPYFANIGRSLTRGSIRIESLAESEVSEFLKFFERFHESSAFNFFRVFSGIGDIAIQQFSIQKRRQRAVERDLNAGKFLSYNYMQAVGAASYTSTNPGSIKNVDSLYLLPKSFVNARHALGVYGSMIDENWNRVVNGFDEVVDGENLMQNTAGNRISDEMAASMEATLNATYCPFFIRDMRTNEIIGFHAFLDSLTDGFSANYSEVRGFGRIEPAYIYESSNRQIGVSFTMFAFSRDDLDFLYWKLNKLVTLIYPQWSKGTLMKTGEGEDQKRFFMPFSQIPTASPLVRLRIGDLITSNYSHASTARMLGMGQPETYDPTKNPEDPGANTLWREHAKLTPDAMSFYRKLISPERLIVNDDGPAGKKCETLVAAGPTSAMALKVNKNPEGPQVGMDVMFKLKNMPAFTGGYIEPIPKAAKATSAAGQGAAVWSNMSFGDGENKMGWKNSRSYINNLFNLFAPDDTVFTYRIVGFRWRDSDALTNPYEVILMPVSFDMSNVAEANYNKCLENFAWLQTTAFQYADNDTKAMESHKNEGVWKQHINDMFFDFAFSATTAANTGLIKNKLYRMPLTELGKAVDFDLSKVPYLNNKYGPKFNKASFVESEMSDAKKADLDFLADNPIIRSFKSSQGSGMAGFIDQLGIDWQIGNFPWETEIGMRAPIGCKITLGFKPIHDITPGIDADGMNRAPVYNLGKGAKSLNEENIGIGKTYDEK